ncbi:MAG: prohibitin family protein [Bacteroidetes bacterium]|nr:prohibitin family protein [Bacteroidota bacterium]
MTLFIIGLLLFLFAKNLTELFPQIPTVHRMVRLAGLALAVVGIANASVKQIDAGHVGVQSLFGKVQEHVLTSGLNVINPFVDVHTFDIKTQNYTMSAIATEGDKTGDDAIRVLSADGLEVIIDLTILYSVIPSEAPNIYREIGVDYKNVIVRPITRTKIRDNAVYYDAVALYSKQRDEFQAKIFKSIENDFKARGLVLEQLLVRNITLPPSVKAAIESKINAEQDAQKMQFVLQKEKQEAERKRVEAQGIADYQRIINSEITDKLLQYESIKAQKEIALSPNSKVIIMGKGAGSVLISDK